MPQRFANCGIQNKRELIEVKRFREYIEKIRFAIYISRYNNMK